MATRAMAMIAGRMGPQPWGTLGGKRIFLVRKKGLEPPRREALEPKSSASTNSATFAQIYELLVCNMNARILPQTASIGAPGPPFLFPRNTRKCLFCKYNSPTCSTHSARARRSLRELPGSLVASAASASAPHRGHICICPIGRRFCRRGFAGDSRTPGAASQLSA